MMGYEYRLISPKAATSRRTPKKFWDITASEFLLKLVEQIAAIVRAGRGFWVVLDTAGVELCVANSGDGVIVEIAMSDLQ